MFSAIIGRKTVANVLSAFNKAVDDLRQVEEEQESEAVKQAQAIVEAQAAHDAAINEAALAREVSRKLMSMITPVMPEIGLGQLAETEAK